MATINQILKQLQNIEKEVDPDFKNNHIWVVPEEYVHVLNKWAKNSPRAGITPVPSRPPSTDMSLVSPTSSEFSHQLYEGMGTWADACCTDDDEYEDDFHTMEELEQLNLC